MSVLTHLRTERTKMITTTNPSGHAVCPPGHGCIEADGPRRPKINKILRVRSQDGVLQFWPGQDQDGSLFHNHQDHHGTTHEHCPDSIPIQLCSDKEPREK